jgi:hypothetical protein
VDEGGQGKAKVKKEVGESFVQSARRSRTSDQKRVFYKFDLPKLIT